MNRALRVTDAARIGISVVALIVGGLAVANTVAMGVFERVREFGTLRAIGARPGTVRALVLTESVLLALVGGAGGVLVGMAGNAGVNAYTRGLAGIDAAALTPGVILMALAVSTGLGLLAALIPAQTSARVPVTEALNRV